MTASPSIGLRHLTPDEWVEGSCDSMWSDYNRTVELPPANRAETWIRKLYQASAYSAESNSFYRTWFSPAVSEEEWKALHEKFPSDDGCGGTPPAMGCSRLPIDCNGLRNRCTPKATSPVLWTSKS